MKTPYTFLTLFWLVCFSGFAQVDDFQKEIVDYLNLNGTRQQYQQAYDGVYPMLKENFEKFEIPKTAWDKLKSDKEEEVDEVIEMLSFAYRNHFTKEEISEMKAFYSTDAAKKMISGTQLSEEEADLVQDFQKSKVAKKFKKVQKKLTADIETISSDWSRELFKEKMKSLIVDGYVY